MRTSGTRLPAGLRRNARRKELDELLTRYPTKMAALLPALWIVQEERGWVSEPAMAEVAAVLGSRPRTSKAS